MKKILLIMIDKTQNQIKSSSLCKRFVIHLINIIRTVTQSLQTDSL